MHAANGRVVARPGSRDGQADAPLISSGRTTASFNPTSASRNSASTPNPSVVVENAKPSTTPSLPTHPRTDVALDSVVTEARSAEQAHLSHDAGANGRTPLVHIYIYI